ncbi:MAG TPA: mechanosensitive ion channel domain-containing protein [Methylomirabilota bacterium]|nr:mechanosensitive ion channel domain-containing protein [Methylomirabilota bacterium]
MDLQAFLETAEAFVVNHYLQVIAAVVILLVGWIFAGWAMRLTRKALTRGNVDPTLVPFTAKLIYYAILAVVVIAALNRLGVATTSVVAIFGVAGLAVGLAMQGTLSNFASGVMLLLFRPFKVGDYVDVGGTAGSVEEVSIFSTTLTSPDNIKITVPNSQIYGTTIFNYTGNDTRRVDMVMGISYGDDIQTAIDTISSIVTAHPLVLADPEPVIAVAELADSSVNIVVRPWTKTSDYWTVKFELTRSLKEGLEKAGCSIPFPQRDVYMHQVA